MTGDYDLCAAVWVEVKKGGADAVAPGLTVDSKFYLRKNNVGILNVPGLAKACNKEGVYTVRVMMSDRHGTKVLTTTTFVLESTPFA